MQALVVTEDRRPPVQFRPDHPEPVAHVGEVKIRVHLAGICATDLEIVRGYMHFAGVPGHEFVGTVVEGPQSLVGQRVVADINCPCGTCELCRRGLPNHCSRRTVLGIAGRDGAFAEYLTIPAANCHPVPASITDEQAVFVEPLAAAVHVLDVQPLDARTRVTVLGSGRLGLLVAQVLAAHGCNPLVVGRNPRTLSLCEQRGLRARQVADVKPAADQDVVVECTGAPDGLRLALQLCRPCGTIILKSTYADPAPLDLAPVVIHEINVVGSRCGSFPPALKLLEEGAVEVDRLVGATYPLTQGVEALAAAARPECIKVLLRPGAA